AGAAQGMAALHGRAFLARDVLLDPAAQGVGAAAQALQLARDELGVLERGAVDFLREALHGLLREAQEIGEVAGRAERAAAGLGIHARSIGLRGENAAQGTSAGRRVVSARRGRRSAD